MLSHALYRACLVTGASGHAGGRRVPVLWGEDDQLHTATLHPLLPETSCSGQLEIMTFTYTL